MKVKCITSQQEQLAGALFPEGTASIKPGLKFSNLMQFNVLCLKMTGVTGDSR